MSRGRATRSVTAASAASRSSLRLPLQNESGPILPSTTFASVTVGFRSPSAVTDRAGHGPGAVRADVQFAELVHGSDAAASRPYRSDLYRWDTEPVALDDTLPGEAGLAVHDESNIEARASHVSAYRVLHTESSGESLHAHNAADGPRREACNRPAPQLLARREAPVGLHQQQRLAQTALTQPRVDLGEVPVSAGGEVGVHQRRIRALELTQGRCDVAGEVHRQAGRCLFNEFPCTQFVLRIEERPEEHHRDGVHSQVTKLADRL